MLNAKQGSCKYQFLKSFSLIRPGNRTLVYQLRGKRFSHTLVATLISKNGLKKLKTIANLGKSYLSPKVIKI